MKKILREGVEKSPLNGNLEESGATDRLGASANER